MKQEEFTECEMHGHSLQPVEIMDINEIDRKNCEVLVEEEKTSFFLLRGGCTRHVLLIGNMAIKIPHLNFGWSNFLRGLLGNMQEVTMNTLKDDRMAPIKFSLRGGWLLIMPRCKPLTPREFNNLNIDDFWKQDFTKVGDNVIFHGPCKVPVEEKIDSFGWYKGRIVAIDYGS